METRICKLNMVMENWNLSSKGIEMCQPEYVEISVEEFALENINWVGKWNIGTEIFELNYCKLIYGIVINTSLINANKWKCTGKGKKIR